MTTFEMQCYENDYEFVLNPEGLKNVIAGCTYTFTKKVVIINKVLNRKKVIQLAENCKKLGIIDTYYFVDDYIDRVLTYFSLSESSFAGGFAYSRSQLVGIYLCKTEYLLHFNADAYIKKNKNSNWISDAIQLMKKNPKYICANPYWEPSSTGAKKEALTTLKNWYVCSGFTDNCYLIPTKLFKKRIYSEYNPDSDRYPYYAGDCFERKINSYMKNHTLFRIVNKQVSFTHTNFPKKKLIKWLDLLTYNTIKVPLRIKQLFVTLEKNKRTEILEYRKKIKVYDIFSFFNELELLEIRLEMLYPFVDYFVIIESNETFSGLPKKLYYSENKKRFKKYAKKIIHYVINDVPADGAELRNRLQSNKISTLEREIIQNALTSDNVPPGQTHWLKEFYQKESIKKAIIHLKSTDICFISDVDEIWNPELLIDYRNDDIFKLHQKMYVYFLNNRSNEPWAGTLVTKYKNIKKSCLNHLRTKSKTTYSYLANGGWHFSFQGGEKRVQKKIESYGHQEFNTVHIKSQIKKNMETNSDFIGRKFKFWVDESELPRYILENKKKYKSFFK